MKLSIICMLLKSSFHPKPAPKWFARDLLDVKWIKVYEFLCEEL